ncbi:MAG TPA: enolase C-terminal domain-like protein [Thermoanaerobaculia bacterium]|nr:enolase C-terminal domain-like protein [Thermoanaerobaculia bacterium]
MRLWVHRYTLAPRRPLSGVARAGVREGALLRVDGGFADVHPWPELGDAPLDEQLALLARGETTSLTAASLRLASLDADARRRGVSLFEGLTIPESHWPGADPPAGFDTVKIKGVQAVPEHVRIRIDFNATLTAEEFLRIASTLPRERIDFIEDPCPYDARTWRALRSQSGLRLALDRFSGEADVLVHKPALAADFPTFNGEVVVTSYMDHPVGQFGAAYIAATNRVSRRCGLMTHVLYEPDAFIERIERDGARLLPPRGTGIGFDELLENLSWTELR